MANRLPTSTLELPNNTNDIRVPVNTTASNIEFNKIVRKLDDNFQYLLQSSTVVDNRSPISYDYVYHLVDSSSRGLITDPTAIAHDYKFIKVINKPYEDQVFICAKVDSIDFYVYDESEDTLTLEETYYKFRDIGNHAFINISNVELYNNQLYVYDSSYEIIVTYDINAFVYGDVILDDTQYITQIFNLKDIVSFRITPSAVYAITTTQLIKYNRDFNVIDSVTLVLTNPTDILISDSVYVLNDHTLSMYATDLTYIGANTYSLFPDEVFTILRESEVDDDVIYLMCENYIVKADITNQDIVGYFKMDRVDDSILLNFHIETDGIEDAVYIMDEFRVHYTTDALLYVELVDINNIKDVVNIDDLELEKLELEQDYVFNVALQKLLFNTLLLYNSIIYKTVVITEVNGVIEYSHILNQSNRDVINDIGLYMGQNEVFSYQVFKKAFEGIYDIQLKIQDILGYDYVNSDTNTLII